MDFFPAQTYQDLFSELYLQIERLNPEQKRAVLHTNGPLLVVAGAGSGKTRVATLRIGRLIAEGVDPKSILGLTFTNKASQEMKKRVSDLVGSSVLISTFHSLGARVLREFSHVIDYPASFVIYDEADKEKLLKSCLRKFQAEGKESLIQPDEAIRAISNIKNSAKSAIPPQISELFAMYQAELKKACAMDFDDLQYQFLLLLQIKEVSSVVNERWKYLLVDEYQDTNDIQSEIAALLSGEKCNIFAVGDPDQSIYSWRGANLQHILAFQSRFQNAEEIRLEKNYRSTNVILEASNFLIKNNQKRVHKNLWSDRSEGEPILCFVAHNERQEAEYVIQGISSLHSDRNIPFSEIAVLYRTNAQSRSFEDELIRRHIPYVIWGGLSFYQRREIKDVLSFARLSLIPQDIIAFERVINIPKRGIGATTVEKLIRYASDSHIPIITLIRDLIASHFSSDFFSHIKLSLTSKQKNGLIQFIEILSQLEQISTHGSAFQLISAAIHDTQYLEYLENEEDENYVERRENLEQLIAKAIEWDQEQEAKEESSSHSLFEFFEMISLETAVQESKESQDRVTLATMHNAKGLEFSSVFLVGLEEDLFPHINVKWGKDDIREEDIEEERRLMYVGMTRAKDLLSLSLAKSRMLWGGFRSMRPSRFLYEIPERFLQKIARFPIQTVHQKASLKNTSHPQSLEKHRSGDLIIHNSYGIGRILTVSETSLGDIYEILFSSDSSVRKIVAGSHILKSISSPKS